MEKYIGNKKSIVAGIEKFLLQKGIHKGLFIDAFSGTTNVGQYFKQRGYSVICNDINEFSFVLGKVYIENNEFPAFIKLIKIINDEGFYFDEQLVDQSVENCLKKIRNDKTYPENYIERVNYNTNIRPLIRVLQYLNNLNIESLTLKERLFFDYYTEKGKFSKYISTRNTVGRRNYFTPENAKHLGVIMQKINFWRDSCAIDEMEFYILLAAVIEEVTLIANVNGTFHDFNRKKLYPNALQKFELKSPILNIYSDSKFIYKIFNKDSNELKYDTEFMTLIKDESILYIDPPYNFRQYSAYYHLLNFLARYHRIDDILAYATKFKFVRGQNMEDNFNSSYCYRDQFIDVMEDLILGIPSSNIVISYYDENNHWNHGKDSVSMEGRNAILEIFKEHNSLFVYDTEPHIIPRINYQSQSGARKKQIDELIFFARRRLNVD